MRSSTKVFFVILLFGCIAGFLFYKGLEQEYLKRQEVIPSIAPEIVNEEVLGEINESTSASTLNLDTVAVIKVVDGDTIRVLIDGKEYAVRFIGIDTPETVHPTKGKECFGSEASNKTKELLTNKRVILEKDVSESDTYGRLLRYVYLPMDDGKRIFVNDYLVREGYAQVLTYPPDVAFNEQFLEAQRTAKNMKKGLWSVCQN